ncbi:MAG: flagellar assembly protein FliH [Woeseiaceae bacterium]
MSEAKAAATTGARKWDVPAIDGSSGQGYLTASRLEELQKQAYDEAFQQGHAEGLKAGEEEIRNRAARYDQLLQALSAPFDQLDETVEKQLVELAVTVVRQLFRREIKLDPTHIIGVVRDSVRLLPVSSRNIQVCLHPDDAALIRQTLSKVEGERAWTIVEDPLISRGGCQVTTDNSQIDAQCETRLNAAISAMLGDERR